MRFIDNRFLQKPDPEWENRATTAKNDVLNNGADINSHGEVWRCCKGILADKSHDKCWYCEIKQERSDNAVDHYRPQSKYKWLAFGIENFRYSCTYCNSLRRDDETQVVGGKGDKFPLVDESKRATAEGQEAEEQPLLLDPCNAHDPSLLSFLDDGTPTAKEPTHATRKLRAESSIKLYHLNHTDLMEKRRKLALDLNAKIISADRLYNRVDTGDASIDQSYNEHVRDLKSALSEEAELSSFARAIVMGRRDLVWIDSLIQTH